MDWNKSEYLSLCIMNKCVHTDHWADLISMFNSKHKSLLLHLWFAAERMELHKYFTSLFTTAPAEDAGKADSPAESYLSIVELDEVVLNPTTLVSLMDCWAIASEWLLNDVSLHLSFCLLHFFCHCLSLAL